ncbi:uncharacterized protein LOC135394895 [Ornithodoros turicata]|uniref:uncharacterized protein LOC135394895 n=1 Tax=Ornithodoros turicata TaxID=34597 RepID=UPI003138D705
MAYGNSSKWHDCLPLVLLGLRDSWKEDLGCTAADLVYGTSLALPAQFFEPTSSTAITPSDYVEHLREHFSHITPTPRRAHKSGKPFVSPQLTSATHVFLRTDALRKSLQPPYSGPFPVLERHPKYFVIHCHGRPETVSIDRLKPAFVDAEDTPAVLTTSTAGRPSIRRKTPKRVSWSVQVRPEEDNRVDEGKW